MEKEYADEWFWLKWVKSSIEESPGSVDQQINGITESLKYVFTLQIVGGILNLTFNEINNWLVVIFLCLPQPFFIIAYYFSTSRAKIELAHVDPKDPDDAIKAYDDIMNDKIGNLKIARAFALIGFLLLFLALFLSSILKLNNGNIFEKNSVKVKLFKKDGIEHKRQLRITGHLPAKTNLIFYLDSYFDKDILKERSKGTSKDKDLLIFPDTFGFLNTESGDFLVNITVNPNAVKYSFRIEWLENNIYKSLRDEIDDNGNSLIISSTAANDSVKTEETKADESKYPDLKNLGVTRPPKGK